MTKAEAKRISAFHLIGCIACNLDGHPDEPYDVHHIVDGYRLGHRHTIPLCPWHHRGLITKAADTLKGPSMFHTKREFIAKYGTELDLLYKVDSTIGFTWNKGKLNGRYAAV